MFSSQWLGKAGVVYKLCAAWLSKAKVWKIVSFFCNILLLLGTANWELQCIVDATSILAFFQHNLHVFNIICTSKQPHIRYESKNKNNILKKLKLKSGIGSWIKNFVSWILQACILRFGLKLSLSYTYYWQVLLHWWRLALQAKFHVGCVTKIWIWPFPITCQNCDWAFKSSGEYSYLG